MFFHFAALAAFCFVVFGVIPIYIVSFLRQPYGSMSKSKATAAVGNALQDLDRLLARPSVEHKIEAEQQTHKRDDDDIGGE